MLRATLHSVLLVLSVFGGGFIGPSSQLLETESAWVVTGYSLLLRSIYCMPIIPFEAMFSKRKYKDRLRQLLTCKSLVFLTLAPAFQLIFTFGLLFGSANLIQAHSYVCNTLFCIPVALIGYCRFREKPMRIELIGLSITLGAIVCMFADPSAERTDGKQGEAWVYVVCIACACLAAGWVLMNEQLLTVAPCFFNLWIQGIIGYVYVVVICLSLFFYQFEFSMDKAWGAFGLFHEDQLSVTWLLYGPSHGFFGSAGYLICLNYFSPVVVSASFLMEPCVGAVVGYYFGIDELPGWMTWAGVMGVIFGISLVQVGERKRKKERINREIMRKVKPLQNQLAKVFQATALKISA